MPRIAILGASGFLGSQILIAFEAKDWEVVTFSWTQSTDSLRKEIITDLFDEATLRSAVSQTNPDVVLSTAWDTEHGKFGQMSPIPLTAM